MLRYLIWVLIGLSVLTFVFAVIATQVSDVFLRIKPAGFSNACTNLALIAIALLLASKKKGTKS